MISLVLLASSACCTLATLVQLNIVMRHGARTPVLYVPDGSFNASQPESLTNLGIQQQYALGERLRERYIRGRPYSFISQQLVEKQMLVRSSYMARTVESADAMLAGLLPPSGGQVWDPNLKWRPHAVFTQKTKQDPVTNRILSENCPLITEQTEYELSTAPYKKWIPEVKVLIKFVEQKLGFAAGTFTITTAWKLYDYVLFSVSNGLAEPWMLESWRGNITVYDALWDMQTTYFYARFIYGDIKNLMGGILLAGLVSNMNKFRSGDRMNTYVYSTHQEKLVPMFYLLGLKQIDMHAVLPSSAAIFELHRESNGLVVKLLFYSPDTKNFTVLDIPGCANPCPLKKLTYLTRSAAPKHWKKLCKITQHKVWRWWSLAIGVCCLIIIFICIAYKVITNRSRKPENSQLLHS